MICEYCHGEGWHHQRCPLYEEPKPAHYCSICKEGIYNGEEYIVNDCGEDAHWECVDYGRDLVRFLGYEIKTMENGYEI
mgnify:CR=1 FL=1